MIRVQVDDSKYLQNTRDYRGLCITNGYVVIFNNFGDNDLLKPLLSKLNCMWVKPISSLEVISRQYFRGHWQIPFETQDSKDIAYVVNKILNSGCGLEPLLYEDKLYIADLGYSTIQGKNLYETIKRSRKQN